MIFKHRVLDSSIFQILFHAVKYNGLDNPMLTEYNVDKEIKELINVLNANLEEVNNSCTGLFRIFWCCGLCRYIKRRERYISFVKEQIGAFNSRTASPKGLELLWDESNWILRLVKLTSNYDEKVVIISPPSYNSIFSSIQNK